MDRTIVEPTPVGGRWVLFRRHGELWNGHSRRHIYDKYPDQRVLDIGLLIAEPAEPIPAGMEPVGDPTLPFIEGEPPRWVQAYQPRRVSRAEASAMLKSWGVEEVPARDMRRDEFETLLDGLRDRGAPIPADPDVPVEPPEEVPALRPQWHDRWTAEHGWSWWGLGDEVDHDGKAWRSLVSVNTWEPGTPGVWQEIAAEPGGIPDWSPSTYQIGDEVAHAGSEWISRRANNVWEPGTSDAGWLRLIPHPGPWVHIGSEGYPTTHPRTGDPMRVTHIGRRWRNDSPGNFWTPGAALWVDEGPA